MFLMFHDFGEAPEDGESIGVIEGIDSFMKMRDQGTVIIFMF